MEDICEAIKYRQYDEAHKIADKIILWHATELIKNNKQFYLHHLILEGLFRPTDNAMLNLAVHDITMYHYLCQYVKPNAENLFYAVKEGELEIVKYLFAYLDLSTQDSKALRLASFYGFLPIVKYLAGLSDVTAFHNQALKWATEKEHGKVVKFLLTVPGTRAGVEEAKKRTRNKKILRYLSIKVITVKEAKPVQPRNPALI